MHYPEFDVLCHEVAGKLAELRRLTMETVILTDDQEALLAELTRLLRLVDAASSQQLHSLLGDTSVEDSAFLAELREELPLLTEVAEKVAISPSSSLLVPQLASLPDEFASHQEKRGSEPPQAEERARAGEMVVRPVPPGLLEEIYWEIRPVSKGDTRLLFAHNQDWKFCLIVTDEHGQTAFLFDTEEDRAAYLETLTKGEG